LQKLDKQLLMCTENRKMARKLPDWKIWAQQRISPLSTSWHDRRWWVFPLIGVNGFEIWDL